MWQNGDSNKMSLCKNVCCSLLMLFTGFLFSLLIAKLSYDTYQTAVGNETFCTLWTDIPGRLAIFIVCYYAASMCGYFPVPRRYRLKWFSEPFTLWRLESWRRLFRDLCFPAPSVDLIRRLHVDALESQVDPRLYLFQDDRFDDCLPIIRRRTTPVPIEYPDSYDAPPYVPSKEPLPEDSPDIGEHSDVSFMSFDSSMGGPIVPMVKGKRTKPHYLPDSKEKRAKQVASACLRKVSEDQSNASSNRDSWSGSGSKQSGTRATSKQTATGAIPKQLRTETTKELAGAVGNQTIEPTENNTKQKTRHISQLYDRSGVGYGSKQAGVREINKQAATGAISKHSRAGATRELDGAIGRQATEPTKKSPKQETKDHTKAALNEGVEVVSGSKQAETGTVSKQAATGAISKHSRAKSTSLFVGAVGNQTVDSNENSSKQKKDYDVAPITDIGVGSDIKHAETRAIRNQAATGAISKHARTDSTREFIEAVGKQKTERTENSPKQKSKQISLIHHNTNTEIQLPNYPRVPWGYLRIAGGLPQNLKRLHMKNLVRDGREYEMYIRKQRRQARLEKIRSPMPTKQPNQGKSESSSQTDRTESKPPLQPEGSTGNASRNTDVKPLPRPHFFIPTTQEEIAEELQRQQWIKYRNAIVDRVTRVRRLPPQRVIPTRPRNPKRSTSDNKKQPAAGPSGMSKSRSSDQTAPTELLPDLQTDQKLSKSPEVKADNPLRRWIKRSDEAPKADAVCPTSEKSTKNLNVEDPGSDTDEKANRNMESFNIPSELPETNTEKKEISTKSSIEEESENDDNDQNLQEF